MTNLLENATILVKTFLQTVFKCSENIVNHVRIPVDFLDLFNYRILQI